MDGAVDLRLIITLAGILVSVVGATTVAKQQIKQIAEHLADIEARLRRLDSRTDRHEGEMGMHAQRVDVLSSMMDPATMERRHRETADLQARLATVARDVEALKHMHNGRHPPVATL